jgi:hypothetical protein
MKMRIIISVVLLAGAFLARPQTASAQTMKSCPHLTSNIHQALDCIEGIFSENPVHLTMSSVPPGNGFPIGVLYDDPVHHVGGYKSLTETKLALVGSTNGSWYATGSFTWLPPLHYTDRVSNGVLCHQLGALCTKDVLSLELYGTHRSIKSLSFYGIGSRTADTEYLFKETETYGGVIVRMPLWNWLRVDGQVEDRQPSLPAGAGDVGASFSEATAPGLASQPNFMHYAATIRTDATHIAERASNPLGASSRGVAQPLMKSRVVSRFQNSGGYHWYNDSETGHYSFQQFVFDGDESFAFGSVLQRFVAPGTSWLVAHLCNGNKATDTCDFGTLDVKPFVVLSSVAGTRAVPFYFQPTLGGSDIESRSSLRGFDNYRFRDADVAVLQLEYGRPIVDPISAFVFYDGGTVGSSLSDLSASRIRQDTGVGVAVRLQGRVVLQIFAAVGAGGGVHFGSRFEKLF